MKFQSNLSIRIVQIFYTQPMAITFKHLDTLRLFVEVAQHGSLTEAAAAMNMTKGAVSYQIKTLEVDLGAKVFGRTPRGVVLTEAGRQLLTMARPHFREIEQAIAAISGAVCADADSRHVELLCLQMAVAAIDDLHAGPSADPIADPADDEVV